FVWVLGRRSLMKLCLGLAATSFFRRLMVVESGIWHLTAYLATPCRLDGLVAGGFSPDDGLVLIFGFAALAVFFSGLIVLAMDAVEGAWLRRALEHDGLRAIGKYSYGMYISHSLILMVGAQLLSPWIRPGELMSKSLALAWVSAASFAAAWLSYHLYEKHFLRLKCFIEYREPTPSAAVLSSHVVSYDHA